MMPPFAGSVEVRPSFVARPRVSHVLFDFDGTLSLIREGWQEIMAGLFLDMPRGPDETDADLRNLIFDEIVRLTGHESIHQMVRLADLARERGGEPRDPHAALSEFQFQLGERTVKRRTKLRNGIIHPDEMLVFGSRPFLEQLLAAGMTLHLASGTDEASVRREANLLDIARYFGNRIHGPRNDGRTFTKKAVIEQILREHAIAGDQLLAFGDGPVEIDDTKAAGGLAVAVASDEAHNGAGHVDERKRTRLIAAGADVVLPDYRDGPALLAFLRGQ